ncbi:hypothetical protein [Phreatobacter sp.]|uniref:hypothetical protein n=1 Tax=Phreatobacter sp. TaxID=1966341 RepID=UPI003F6EEEC7
MEATNTQDTAFARWLPLVCFTTTVGSTLSVLILQAMVRGDGADLPIFAVFRWMAGWLGFTALLAAGVVGGIYRMGLLDPWRFHSSSVQDVTLILMGALIAGLVVILLANGGGLLWGGASMTMAAVGLVPLLAVRLRAGPAGRSGPG